MECGKREFQMGILTRNFGRWPNGAMVVARLSQDEGGLRVIVPSGWHPAHSHGKKKQSLARHSTSLTRHLTVAAETETSLPDVAQSLMTQPKPQRTHHLSNFKLFLYFQPWESKLILAKSQSAGT